jgi:hypothetical protein
MGSNAVLKLRGKNGSVLRKIYSHEDPVKGAVIGDLKSDNITQILARFDITPGEEKDSAEILTWEFSYIPEGSKDPISLTGSFSVDFTGMSIALRLITSAQAYSIPYHIPQMMAS